MKILCIVGATATGKSKLGIYLAQKFKGEIVNFDSRQTYRDFPIITAQPTKEERALCPHHLYGFLEAQERINAGEFANRAHECIKEIDERGNIPILVGGTGLYLRAILYGLAQIPPVEDSIRKRVIEEYKRMGGERMWQRLKEVDPEYALKIHPRDKQRITRALEVYEATGRPFSWFHHHRGPIERKYHPLKIGIHTTLSSLTPRLARRIDQMVREGGIEEVRSIWEKGLSHDSFIWSAIGCREVVSYLEGKISLDEAKERWLKNTRRYAKRQITWFKGEKDIVWIQEEDIEGAKKKVERFLEG